MSAAKKLQLQSLPDDLETLKSIIAQLSSRVAALEEYVLLSRINKYGASSEKSPAQQEMFNEAELSVVAEEILIAQEAEREAPSATSTQPEKKAGRKPLSAKLPRLRVEHAASEADRLCDCGCERVVIGEETSEQLDIIPARVQVIVNVRKQYACRHCENGGENRGAATAAYP